MRYKFPNATTLRRWVGPLIVWGVYLAAVVVWWTSNYFVSGNITPAAANKSWPYEVQEFYKRAAVEIADRAIAGGYQQIYLEREYLPGNEVISSPCNKGLAEAITDYLKDKGSKSSSAGSLPHVMYYDEPLFTSDIGRSIMLTACPSSMLPPKGWFDIGGMPASPPAANTGMRAVIAFQDFSLGGTQAAADVQIDELSPQPANLLKFHFESPSTHLNWFARPVTSSTLAGLCLFTFLLLLLVVISYWISPRFQRVIRPEGGGISHTINAGLLLALLGQLCLLLLLVLMPIPRIRIPFTDRLTVLHFVIDTSSGTDTWFGQTNAVGNRAGVADFTEHLQAKLYGRVSSPKRDPFWKWLFKQAPRAIVKPQEFDVFKRFGINVTTFSGSPDPAQQDWEIQHTFKTVAELRTATGCPQFEREPRLLDPSRDLPAAPPQIDVVDYWIVVTPGVAADAEDGTQCDHRLDPSAWDKQHTAIIVVPNLPQSASSLREADYAEARVRRLGRMSDCLLFLNKADADIAGVSIPYPSLFELANVSFQSPQQRSSWDIPRDYQTLREAKLQTDSANAKKVADDIAGILSQRIDQSIINNGAVNSAVSHVDVLGRNPAMIAVLIVLCCLLGFMAFVRERNQSAVTESVLAHGVQRVLQIIKQEIGLRIAAAMFLLLAMLLIILRLIWLTELANIATEYGSPRLAVATVLFCWLSWVIAPHLYFIAGMIRAQHGAGLRIGPRRFEYARPEFRWSFFTARGYAMLLASFAVVALLICLFPEPIGTVGKKLPLGLRFGATPLLVLLPVLLAMWPVRLNGGRRIATTTKARIAWWAQFRWSLLTKAILVLGLAALARGALPSTPVPLKAGVLTAGLSTFHGFVLFIAAIWSLLAMAIVGASTDTQIKRNRVICLLGVIAIPLVTEVLLCCSAF